MPLYAFGSNASGQLGIGNREDTSTPTICSFLDALPCQPKKIVAGGNHTLLHLEDGTVFRSGKPLDGKMCYPESSQHPANTFQKAYPSSLGKVKLCSAWWDGSVFIDIDGLVFTAGLGSKGEQGTGGASAFTGVQGLKSFPPDRGPESGNIVDLDSGVDHTVVVMADGTMWGWGNGRRGKLGSNDDFVWAPRQSEWAKYSVARAVCGRDFTFLMLKNGGCKILGTNKWNLQSNAPEHFPDWKDIHASWGSVFLLKPDGHIESWGRNDHGQLAPPNLPAVEKLAVGSEHAIALTKDGKVISWGWGEHGNCGTGADESGDVKGNWNEIPVEPSQKVLGVGAGCATSFFWTETNSDF